MASPGRRGVKEMPKRNRYPPKKLRFCEQIPDEQLHERDGLFVFVTFEDGYTAKIFKSCDILNEDESPIGSFKDLKPGRLVLARWSNNKFYKAIIDYIGLTDQNQKEKGGKKDMKKNDLAAQRFYSTSSGPSTVPHAFPKTQLKHAGQSLNWFPPAQTQCKPTCIPAQHQSPLLLTQHQSSLPPWNTQPVRQTESCDQSGEQPDFMDLDEHQNQAIPNSSPKESFLGILFNPSVDNIQPYLPPSVENTNQNNSPELEDEHSNPSSADTVIIERHPSPECGMLKDFSPRGPEEDKTWEPCDACKQKVEAMMKERRRMKEMLACIKIEHLQAVRNFLDFVEEHKGLESGLPIPKANPGQHELYPGSGLFLSSTRLAAIQQEAKKDCLRLFHLLFDEFFTPEECINCVAFGKHGKVPTGKKRLDEIKVNGILTYVMSCGKLHGWEPVEKAKLKKAVINKCRMRAKSTTF